jgi:DNA-binding NarL/FixJ family response regulator
MGNSPRGATSDPASDAATGADGVTQAALRVLVADDHALVRAGFRSILSGEGDMEVIEDAVNGREAVAIAVRAEPDVILMDVRMPILDGIEATSQITANPRLAQTKVIVLTTFDLDEYIFGALRAGASAFLLKGVEPVALIDAVRTVAAGNALLDPGATRRLIEAYVASPAAGQHTVQMPDAVTGREREILALVAGGLTNSEIADRLVVSPLTIKSHVSRILAKLGARDRTQLVVIAYESGLVVPGQPANLRTAIPKIRNEAHAKPRFEAWLRAAA